MIIPKPLRPGSRIALLSASGGAPPTIDKTTAAVRRLGLEPVVFPSATSRYGYLGGTDEMRAADLNAAFADCSIDGIVCSRGGYGAARILPMLDTDMIAKNPKPLFGYSDVTALHIMLDNLGIGSFHTPMPSTEWVKELDEYTEGWLRDMLFGQERRDVTNPSGAAPMRTLVPGKARGRMTGGNLSLLAASLATPWEVETSGKILFIEEVGEFPYRVDRMLVQLRDSGKLGACAGIVLGAFTDCVAAEPERSLTLEQVIDDIVKPLGVPAVTGLVCGHCLPTASLPMGRIFTLDATAAVLTVGD